MRKPPSPQGEGFGWVGSVRLAIEASFPDICAIPSDKIEEAKEAIRTRMKAFPSGEGGIDEAKLRR